MRWVLRGGKENKEELLPFWESIHAEDILSGVLEFVERVAVVG